MDFPNMTKNIHKKFTADIILNGKKIGYFTSEYNMFMFATRKIIFISLSKLFHFRLLETTLTLIRMQNKCKSNFGWIY